MKPDERAFEEHIVTSLVERGGYREVKVGNASGDFDVARGLDLVELFAFLQHTQPEALGRLVKLHGGETKARERFADRLAKELDSRGGKSNTIAWLAHRLSSLHNENNKKVFDKVVVITDRVVLDKQLQETIYQFEHAHGVVEKIDESSSQLAEALSGQAARIIIITLQKFPFVLDKVEGLPERRYAVLIDEAHSSQTGETAKDMKKVLGSGRARPGDHTTAESDGHGEELTNPAEEALMREAAARGQQDNLSFFAFTATPKGRTLEMFGTYDEEVGHRVPFHLYSMRQAIEEGFIHDVLANYLTYGTYWKIEKAVEEDPEYDSRRAGAAIARFVTLHEHNLAQKARVIVEHFRRHVRSKIGGKAKAMVVTSSRKHAVRMTHALRKYANEQGYDALGILVAFSGTVEDEGATFTEAQMNGFPESQTPREFEENEWRFLVVADKYQTGFDQPLLYAMYVDKVLTGLAAVQTLSRLNRRAEGKDGTFVLDFRNDAKAIRAEFEIYYGKTVAPPTDPNLLYDTRHALDEYDVLRPAEVAEVAALLVADDNRNNHARIHAALTPAIDRFRALEGGEQEAFRDALERFVRTYSFLSQVVSFTDVELERDYRFCRALASFVKRGAEASLDLGSEVELTHLQLEQTFKGSVSPTGDQGTVTAIYDGTGPARDPESSPLSRIVEKLNERFGLKLTEADRLHLDSIAQEMVDDATVQQQAAANTMGNFEVQFPKSARVKVTALRSSPKRSAAGTTTSPGGAIRPRNCSNAADASWVGAPEASIACPKRSGETKTGAGAAPIGSVKRSKPARSAISWLKVRTETHRARASAAKPGAEKPLGDWVAALARWRNTNGESSSTPGRIK